MLDGHLKDVQEIILRQRLDNEVRFKDHSLSRRDTMADTTQITNDNNTLSHVSAQLNPLNITITELKKGTVNLPTINNNPSFSQPLPTFTSKSKISRPILSIHDTVTEIPLLHRVLFGRQTKHQQHNTIHRQI